MSSKSHHAVNGSKSHHNVMGSRSHRTRAGSLEDKSHQAVSSYFIGPQAENLGDFKENIETILDQLKIARLNYYPEDGAFITESIRESATFQECKVRVSKAITKAAELLGQHSLPFWSPRYQAHMCMDMSMPALLGYFMTMIYNPNNVALEASPLTTIAEIEVGEQLCELFGYNLDPEKSHLPIGWGHITCDGTVANLESIWVARNLKFYPLSIFKAMKTGGPLAFVADEFHIETCKGETKLFKELDTWELLNLKPKDVLGIPDRLGRELGISGKFMEKVMEEYGIQNTGKDKLEQEFQIEKPIQFMLSNTRHYSWPKGAAIAGIGADNIVGIDVDDGARLEIDELEKQLDTSLNNKQAVFAVVGIMGSTEEGSVDRLGAILALRRRFQARGLSFLVHADAAWGGYFASMLPTEYHPGDILHIPSESGDGDGFVPDAPLRAQTQEDLFAMRFADSITVDPHKAGYIPYPAGGLCYRDQRMRFLVTWTSPYLSRGAVSSIGIYGVEGSKPGAAAMSTWLSNKCIGLNAEGYGALLSEVTFTCSRFSAEWAAMTTQDMDFTVVPLNMLPAELEKNPTPQALEAQKQRIRTEILSKTNAQIVSEDAGREDKDKAMVLLRALGSDLNINAFALNFRLADGKWNDDVEEANYLMQRVIERLSIDSPEDDPTKIPFILTSTEFSKKLYGKCATNFKRRLGLRQDDLDLFVLRNVVMNPFPTEKNFIGNLAGIFKEVVAEEVKVCQQRNADTAAYHEFLIQGTDDVYLVLLPMFHIANHRQQLIVEIEMDSLSKKTYIELKRASSGEALTLVTQMKVHLPELLKQGDSFKASIRSKDSCTILQDVKVTLKRIVKSRPLNSKYRDLQYPSGHMPFYLYGDEKEMNIEHMLVCSPNIQLSAEGVHLDLDNLLTNEQFKSGAILYMQTINEDAMQPFPATADLLSNPSFWFKPGKRIPVTVFSDPNSATAHGPGLADAYKDQKAKIATGSIRIADTVYVDSVGINKDPFKRVEKVDKWREEFDKIGKSM